MAGASGEKNIVEMFCDFYEGVYNSAESTDAGNVIKSKISALVSSRQGEVDSLLEINKVSGDIVKQAVCKMKPGKGDVSESFTSDAILNAPDLLFDLLAAVFRSWLVHGTVTPSLLACAFLPLL